MRRLGGPRNRIPEYRLNRALARHQYSQAFFILILPFLTLVLVLSNAVRGAGGIGLFFVKHWVFAPLMLVFLAIFVAVIVADLRKGRSYNKKAQDLLRE